LQDERSGPPVALIASLLGPILQPGSLRITTDYPFEEMHEGAEWLDSVPISEVDRLKIGRTNAERVLTL
jgi:hypothetical protein